MRYGLTDKELEIIINILKKYIQSKEVLIFGSRSRGDFHKTSDIDLAITAQVTASELSNLRTMFEESALIYTVDLVTMNGTTTAFQQSIKKDAQPFEVPDHMYELIPSGEKQKTHNTPQSTNRLSPSQQNNS